MTTPSGERFHARRGAKGWVRGAPVEPSSGTTPSASPTTKTATASGGLTVRTVSYNNGDRYRGQMQHGKRHGRGVYIWANGDRYEGEWQGDERTGRGVFTWPSGNRYEGDFVRGKRTGRGVFTWPSGSRYEGDFVDNKRHGRGIYTWPSGNRYEGEFVDGKRTDRGTHTEAGGQAWGAVAVETDPIGGPRFDVCLERAFHISVSFESPAEAGSQARAQCNASGSNCDVKRYFEECAAFARGYIDRTDGGRYCVYGVGVGKSKDVASYYANSNCSSDAMQPLASGLGLTQLEHTDEVYGCEIRSVACNSMTELGRRRQAARGTDTRLQQQNAERSDRDVWVGIADGYRNRNYQGGVLGLSWGRRSESEALGAALADCRAKGGYECGQRSGQSALLGRCIAVAEASWQGMDELYFHALADNRAEASDGALRSCRNVGASGCQIVAAECG